MKKLPNFANDDEDDSILFTRMQEYVLENYPNPQRIGCLDHETLRQFVMVPEQLDLKDPKYLHIVKCAECTRELIELRQLREAALENDSSKPEKVIFRSSPLLANRLLVMLALSVCAVAIIAFVMWKHPSAPGARATDQETVIALTVDLSDAGVTRSVERPSPNTVIFLPRRKIALHLILPYYSPAGDYRISITSVSAPNRIEATANASAVAHGPHTELSVDLDLRKIAGDKLAFNTYSATDGSTSSYSLAVR